MVARGWEAHVHGKGRPFRSATEAIETLYAEDPKIDDQFLPPFVVLDEQGQPSPVQDGDGVLFFNFRGDRAIQISKAFEMDAFPAFDRGRRPAVFYAGMMQYDGDLRLPARYLVEPPAIDATVGEYLALGGRRTFACSETQKYGHVTYFFNGNRSGYIDERLEVYREIPSDVRPFQERPWMKAAEIADASVEAILSGKFDHVRINFANGDMVGHTGDLEATRIAVEAVDLQLARLRQAVHAAQGILLVTADHGNADEMWMRDKKSGQVKRGANGVPVTRPSHTLNPVPFIVYDPLGGVVIPPLQGPISLAAVGTTVLELCGLQAPQEYLPGIVSPRGS
jgi:2,3-bisphosphoglycerate-independent phosphoglycerate mutase